jgi:hypothetical protein
MTISLKKYYLEDFNLIPYKDNISSQLFYENNISTYINQDLENGCLALYLYKNYATKSLSLVIIGGGYISSAGSCSLGISNLPSSFTIIGSGTITSSSSITSNLNWNANSLDYIIIDNIESFTNITINIISQTNVDYIKCLSFNNTYQYLDIQQSPFTLSAQELEYAAPIILEPEAKIYSSPIKIEIIIDSSVQDLVYTTDGTNPTIAKYIAYDNLTPPNPFIAVVEDGLGNVLFDGGFPKWYNGQCNTSWTTFSEMSASYKYLANAINYIANPAKVSSGNKKILILGDAISGDPYYIKGTASYDFKTSIDKVCSIIGYTPTYKVRSDYASGLLDATYSELDQYCCVLLFSTKYTNSKLITDSCINNLVTFRENKNGIFIITDHGEHIPDLDTAINGTYSGFFRTANYLAVNYGAYFTDNYDRTPVNVGFLRQTYGDHPLWNNLSDDENIHAGGSESRVVVPIYDTYTASELPLLSLDEEGYTIYKFLLRYHDNSTSPISFTYGLSTQELVEFLDNNNNVITETPMSVFNTVDVNFRLIPGELGSLSGLIKLNSDVIGETSHDGTNQNIIWYGDTNRIFVKNGDRVVVQITNPIEYTKSLLVNRFQPPVQDEIALARFITTTKQYEWDINPFPSPFHNRIAHIKNALELVEQQPTNRTSSNVSLLKQYIYDTLPLPPTNGFIYATTAETTETLNSFVPPSMQAIYNNWGVFAMHSTADEYYDNISLAPVRDPYNTWVYDATLDSIKQTYNSNYYNGFVSKEKLDYYTHEVTLTSPSNDDDMIGVVIAHTYNATEGKNYVLSATSTYGGNFHRKILGISYNNNAWTVAVRDYDIVNTSPNSGEGYWAGKRIRVKVERQGDYIRVLGTKWNSDVYEPASEMIVDLNSDPRLAVFKGKQSYGYCNASQANSYYQNIVLTGGADYKTIVDAQSGKVYKYINNQWVETGLTAQDVFGYPREVTNPETGKIFYITENSIILLN